MPGEQSTTTSRSVTGNAVDHAVPAAPGRRTVAPSPAGRPVRRRSPARTRAYERTPLTLIAETADGHLLDVARERGHRRLDRRVVGQPPPRPASRSTSPSASSVTVSTPEPDGRRVGLVGQRQVTEQPGRPARPRPPARRSPSGPGCRRDRPCGCRAAAAPGRPPGGRSSRPACRRRPPRDALGPLRRARRCRRLVVLVARLYGSASPAYAAAAACSATLASPSRAARQQLLDLPGVLRHRVGDEGQRRREPQPELLAHLRPDQPGRRLAAPPRSRPGPRRSRTPCRRPSRPGCPRSTALGDGDEAQPRILDPPLNISATITLIWSASLSTRGEPCAISFRQVRRSRMSVSRPNQVVTSAPTRARARACAIARAARAGSRPVRRVGRAGASRPPGRTATPGEGTVHLPRRCEARRPVRGAGACRRDAQDAGEPRARQRPGASVRPCRAARLLAHLVRLDDVADPDVGVVVRAS